MKLFIQIPAFNEAEFLPQTIACLPRNVEGFDEVLWLVVDDGSEDGTAEVALSCGVDYVVSHPRNMGLAAAFSFGLAECLRLGADVIVNTDADNQYDAAGIPSLVEPILCGRADLVIGERPISKINEFSRSKKFLQRLGSKVVSIFSGTEVKDAASGFRAFSRAAAERLRVFGRYTYTLETLVQAGWESLSVTSVPIDVNPANRKSRLVKSVPSYVLKSASAIIRSFALYKPFRFFFLIGMVPLSFGGLLLLRWALLFFLLNSGGGHLVSLIVGGVLVLFGISFVITAFLADLISSNRRLISDILHQVKYKRPG